MVIVVGPNWDLAVKMIKRMKALFEPHNIYFDSKESIIELNGCSIQAYPSNNLGSFRSLTSPKFILIDEADYFSKAEQDEVRHVAERYIGKSDPFIVLCSTPNAPNGLMQKIEQEPIETCIYKKVFLDYTYGVGKIYTQEEIAKAKMSPSFSREYQLQYLGLEGNVISPTAIDRVLELGDSSEMLSVIDNWSIEAKYVLSLDPSWGSSSFAILLSRFINGRIQILYAEEYERPLFQDVINEIWQLKRRCASLQNIIMDSANTEIYTALCHEFKQNPSLQYLNDKQAWAKKINQPLENYLFVCPVPFSTQGQYMLTHAKRIIEETEDSKALVAISKRYDKLITSLKTAQATENRLEKEATVYDDLFDALRLNLSFYRMENK
ncbi:MAG: hypothetical protein ACR2IS_05255 [Nitrososphaeraceae archaeon]